MTAFFQKTKKCLFFLPLFLFVCSFPVFAKSEKFDFLIRDAVVFDGDSYKPISADVGILDDKIAAVGKLNASDAARVIEGRGLVLAPGFIDAHTHSDFNPLVYPGLPNKITQGVTTEIVGNCGMSAAPVLGEQEKHIQEVWAREGVEIKKPSWRTFEEYKKVLLKKGLQTNFTALVGHGNLRAAVMGYSPKPAGPTEILKMKALLRESMNEGAAGISFGLIYLPGLFAQKEELTELCREAGRRGGVCAFHIRSEGSMLLEAIEEAIDIARVTKARVQISHLKAGGRKNWEKISEAFALIEKARAEGLAVEADAYPYTATSAELAIILPDAIYQREDRAELFANPLKREELLAELRKHYQAREMRWETVMIGAAAGKKYKKWEGKTIREISLKEDKEPEKVLVELLNGTKFQVSAFNFSQSEDVVAKVEAKPYVSVGSDSVADGSAKPHPRAYGTFARMFHVYVSENKILQTGELIRKMTSLPADHFRLKNRGRIKAGYFADLVLFDAGEMKDIADYKNSSALSEGVRWVFINGTPVVAAGKPLKDKPGRVLAPGQ